MVYFLRKYKIRSKNFFMILERISLSLGLVTEQSGRVRG